jgi:hypothetical protein
MTLTWTAILALALLEASVQISGFQKKLSTFITTTVFF